MTVQDLVDNLQEICDEHGLDPEEAEVRLAFQPSWPLQYEPSEPVYAKTDEGNFVYIGEDSNEGYLPGPAADKLGWTGSY
jgi:hypothetical protein